MLIFENKKGIFEFPGRKRFRCAKRIPEQFKDNEQFLNHFYFYYYANFKSRNGVQVCVRILRIN